MSKKKIFAIVVFIIFSLFMFSFANPSEVDNNQKTGEVQVDKSKLKDVIGQGNDIIETHGTNSERLKKLENAINNGKEVYEDESTQQEVNAITEEIEEAIENFINDITDNANISLYSNTKEQAKSVTLITTVTIKDNTYIDYVKIVYGTNCNSNGTLLTLNNNNQAFANATINGTYTSCLFLTNGVVKKSSTTINNIKTEKPDTEAPIINLNGNQEVKIVLGQTYEDEKAKVIDNIDPEREINGEINGETNEIGSYEIRYNAKDKAGNEALEVVRTVKVLDPTKDEDNDGFTNQEEIDNQTDFDNPESHSETKAPTITLRGNNPHNMVQNTEYVESGADITIDEHDKETTKDDVVRELNLDIRTVGTYKVKYTITDKYGKSASVERTVNVLSSSEDADNDGYTNKEEIENGTDPLDPDDYPEYDNSPIINISENNVYEMVVYEQIPTFSANATDEADGNVEVTITNDIDANKVGTYAITFKATDSLGNESIVIKDFKVNKREITVTIEDKTSIYGEALEELTYVVTNGTEVATNKANITLIKEDGLNVGSYAITGTYANTNYDVTFVDGTYTITEKRLTENDDMLSNVVFTDKEFVYDGIEKVIEVEGLPAGFTVTYDDNTRTEVGSQVVTATITGDSNYTGSVTKQANLAVNKREITVAIDDKTSIYGDALEELTYVVTNGTEVATNKANITLTKEDGLNVGSYAITGTYANANYDVTFVDGIYTITSKALTENDDALANVVFEGKTFEYDGTEKAIEVQGLPTGFTVTYDDNTRTEVGSQVVTATIAGDSNYTGSVTKQATLAIIGKTLTENDDSLANVVFEGKTFEYDGTEKAIEVQGLPAGFTVTYDDNTRTEVGSQVVTATITGDSNYTGSVTKQATLAIIGKTLTENDDSLANVVFEGKTFEYDGAEKVIEVQGLPAGFTVTYDDNTRTEVGSQVVTATITGDSNYTGSVTKQATLTITTKLLTENDEALANVVFTDREFVYDGTEKTIEVQGLPTGFTVTYDDNTRTEVGSQVVTATITGNSNYTGSVTKQASLTIKSDNPVISSVTSNPTTWAKQVTVTVEATAYNGKTITEYSFDNGITWQTSNSLLVTTNNKELSILVKDSENLVSEAINYTVDNIDTIAPVINVTSPVDANGDVEVVVNVTIIETQSGIKEIDYLPVECDSVEDYKAELVRDNHPVEGLEVLYDESNNPYFEAFYNGTYTIYAIDNAGNESIKTVVITGINADGITDEEAGLQTINNEVQINYSKTKHYSDAGLLWKLRPYRDIVIKSVNGGQDAITLNEVKWSHGRHEKSYFATSGNSVTIESNEASFTLADSRYSAVYTIYIKYTDSSQQEQETTINIYAYARFLFWIV